MPTKRHIQSRHVNWDSLQLGLKGTKINQASGKIRSATGVEVTIPGRGPPLKVHLKDNAIPKFARAREAPLALREAYARRD
ncbi:hypothetical protein EVAR_73155_1 [Eumeta japonica]|uniref:Uncharacterized protein n=1 Tax=Eumeta variegata TaxID=151549 RepID=A0A4C1TAI9_EUMVA|nr:hypothetical protein EVAR_73155_1 [Eumeta japonica]